MTHINFDIEDFLQNYWQQKPLLIRQAFPDFENPVSADELHQTLPEHAVVDLALEGLELLFVVSGVVGVDVLQANLDVVGESRFGQIRVSEQEYSKPRSRHVPQAANRLHDP